MGETVLNTRSLIFSYKKQETVTDARSRFVDDPRAGGSGGGGGGGGDASSSRGGGLPLPDPRAAPGGDGSYFSQWGRGRPGPDPYYDDVAAPGAPYGTYEAGSPPPGYYSDGGGGGAQEPDGGGYWNGGGAPPPYDGAGYGDVSSDLDDAGGYASGGEDAWRPAAGMGGVRGGDDVEDWD